MTYDIYFEAELANHETQYFILDTKGGGKHGDIDFLRYDWSPSRYTLVKEDDVFFYTYDREMIPEQEIFLALLRLVPFLARSA